MSEITPGEMQDVRAGWSKTGTSDLNVRLNYPAEVRRSPAGSKAADLKLETK